VARDGSELAPPAEFNITSEPQPARAASARLVRRGN